MERAIRIKENYIYALELINKNNIKRGIITLENLLLYNSENTNVLNLLALCNLKYCNFEKAREYVNRSIKIKSSIKALEYKEIIDNLFENGYVSKYEGIIKQVKIGAYTRAARGLEEFKNVDKTFIEPYILLGFIYYENNNYLKARLNISKAYKLDSSNDAINKLYIRLKI